MRCDVCDHEMSRWDRPNESPEYWLCPWCYAVTGFNVSAFKVCRPGYMPPDLRWEAAQTEMISDAGRHVYGYQRRTLCGIEKPDMTGSPFGMWGGRPANCPGCVAAAKVIDARWPADRRDHSSRRSIRTDGSEAF